MRGNRGGSLLNIHLSGLPAWRRDRSRAIEFLVFILGLLCPAFWNCQAQTNADQGIQYWFAPGGLPSVTYGDEFGSSSANPIAFSEVVFQEVMDLNPAKPTGSTNQWVTINMRPGTWKYDTTRLGFSKAGSEAPADMAARLAKRTLTIRRDANFTQPTDHVIFRLKPDEPINSLDSASILQNGTTYWFPILRWELDSVEFDCNWTNLLYKANPAYLLGFKTAGLSLSSFTGRLRNVKVRNCGANGLVPIPWWANAGTEAFPIQVTAIDVTQSPLTSSGDPTAWVVEDCEVSDFYGLHGGYATGIMVTVGYGDGSYGSGTAGAGASSISGPINGYAGLTETNWLARLGESGPLKAQTGWRVATVRRCQLRSVPIGLGTAASSSVTFSDNVVVGAMLGLNNDTGYIWNHYCPVPARGDELRGQ